MVRGVAAYESSPPELPSHKFCRSLEGKELRYPAIGFGVDWAQEAHPHDWEIKMYPSRICEYLSLDDVATSSFPMHGSGVVASMPLASMLGSPPMSQKRGRPPKRVVVGRGRPKVMDVMCSDLHSSTGNALTIDVNNSRPVGLKMCALGKKAKVLKKRGMMQKLEVKKCRPSEHAQLSDKSRDEHASVGEGDVCDDELLEAEGPVLHESDDECNLSSISLPTWKSGDGLHVEPNGTFKDLPAFVDIAGPDLGQVPREFTEIQLFLSLFPLDFVVMIVTQTNHYAVEMQDKVLAKHESTRRWIAIDRHSFMHFLGVSLGMSLQFMSDKTYYWKGGTCSVVRYPNYADKMGQTEYQQIKRFLHVRDNSQRPLVKGSREHKLWQILPLEERLNATFQNHYNCGKNVTVDERIIPSKCKLNPCSVKSQKVA
ncbi:hypothetical protein L7F22_029866 [Adiantum nelumboides]|nr:hypothetical protein [Adiantum nelumboides]